ncbi:MAG: hypothetical protein DYH13_02765 [Alphaproteobacteria bacterium PRO2]|nr:hypothetical protein [Alphaproteobacteria bacterium PRO2]
MNKTIILAAALLIAASFSAPAFAQCCGGIPAPENRSVILSAGEQPADAQAPAEQNAEAAADQDAAPETIAPASGEAQAAPASESEPAAAEGQAPVSEEAQPE